MWRGCYKWQIYSLDRIEFWRDICMLSWWIHGKIRYIYLTPWMVVSFGINVGNIASSHQSYGLWISIRWLPTNLASKPKCSMPMLTFDVMQTLAICSQHIPCIQNSTWNRCSELSYSFKELQYQLQRHIYRSYSYIDWMENSRLPPCFAQMCQGLGGFKKSRPSQQLATLYWLPTYGM